MILNGAPRSGKSTIAAAIQDTFAGTWINLGVDVARAMTPQMLQPGIGLRPGENDHRAATAVPILYAALWESLTLACTTSPSQRTRQAGSTGSRCSSSACDVISRRS